MKTDIHPAFHNDAITTCSCGNKIKSGGTIKEQNVEICSACHPFYTGTQKLIDTAGRVDRFKAKMAKAAAAKEGKTVEVAVEDSK
jgi:large subunit ribosomal protein L31